MSLPTPDAYYKLDGNANATIGTNNGVPQNVNWVAGKLGGAASFNGTSTSNIKIPDSNDFTFGANPFTIACWVKRNSINARHAIWGQRDASTNALPLSVQLEFQDDNTIRGLIGVGASAGTYATTVTVTSTTSWNHIILMRNGTNVSIFRNNTTVYSSDAAIVLGASVNNSSNNFGIGTAGDFNAAYGDLVVDDLRIYKQALSQAQRSELYALGSSNFLPFFYQ